jgi:hypothetical protein
MIQDVSLLDGRGVFSEASGLVPNMLGYSFTKFRVLGQTAKTTLTEVE